MFGTIGFQFRNARFLVGNDSNGHNLPPSQTASNSRLFNYFLRQLGVNKSCLSCQKLRLRSRWPVLLSKDEPIIRPLFLFALEKFTLFHNYIFSHIDSKLCPIYTLPGALWTSVAFRTAYITDSGESRTRIFKPPH